MRTELFRHTQYYLCFGKPTPSAFRVGIVEKGVPGWFHRQMLRLLLGIYVIREDYTYYNDGNETIQTTIK